MLIAVLLAAALAGASPAPATSGTEIYTTNCATCHGAQMEGSASGPSLHGSGSAQLDFYLRTGRMPAAQPWIQVEHRDARAGQKLPDAQIAALEAYLAPVVAGGPVVPAVSVNGDRDRGRRVYESNCQQCHAVGGYGGSLGRADWAPALDLATRQEIGDAVRAGPGEMPRFGLQQLTPGDVDDVAAYVLSMRETQRAGAGLPMHSTGPVPEGAVAYVAIVALVVFVFFFWRNDTPPRDREETVRRDEA